MNSRYPNAPKRINSRISSLSLSPAVCPPSLLWLTPPRLSPMAQVHNPTNGEAFRFVASCLKRLEKAAFKATSTWARVSVLAGSPREQARKRRLA